jgi:hypothetical protein
VQQRRVFLFILIDWTAKSSEPHPRKNIATRREEKLSTDRKELKEKKNMPPFRPFMLRHCLSHLPFSPIR